MRINLGNTPLFRGMTVPDIEEMLRCLRAVERSYKKGAVILPEGTPTEQLGVVLSGRVIIEMGDVWGNNSVLSSVGAGGIFAEAYACVPGEPLMVNVTAAEDTEVLLLHIGQVLEPCAKVCPRHLRLLRNLLTLSAGKNLQLSRRVLHTSPKSIRKRLLSYFSECIMLHDKHHLQSNLLLQEVRRHRLNHSQYIHIPSPMGSGVFAVFQRVASA